MWIGKKEYGELMARLALLEEKVNALSAIEKPEPREKPKKPSSNENYTFGPRQMFYPNEDYVKGGN